jgi:hypothetical protein
MPTPKSISKAVETFQKEYGALVGVLWRIILYPMIFLSLYAGKSYLDSHYVDKAHFDESMSVLAQDKEHYNAETQAGLREINGKLDKVIVTQALAMERTGNLNERIIRLETAYDKGKLGWNFQGIKPLAEK